MRKRQTFLLTILSSETGNASFCGRLKVVSTGKSCTFTSIDELYALITEEMSEAPLQELSARGPDQSLPREAHPSSKR
jgi:hypothetical protein